MREIESDGEHGRQVGRATLWTLTWQAGSGKLLCALDAQGYLPGFTNTALPSHSPTSAPPPQPKAQGEKPQNETGTGVCFGDHHRPQQAQLKSQGDEALSIVRALAMWSCKKVKDHLSLVPGFPWPVTGCQCKGKAVQVP